jgi:hypothetical protein
MKKVIIILSVIIVGIIAFYLIYSWQEKQAIFSDENIYKFAQLDGKQQMEYFNALHKEDRMKFIVKFMKNRTFDLPPYELIKFYDDGDFISDGDSEEGGYVGGDGEDRPYRYFVGKWYFKNGKIFFSSKSSYNDNFGKYSIIDDVKIEDFYDKTANFVFHIQKGKDFDGKDHKNTETGFAGGITDDELKAKFNYGVTPAIDSYTKLKQVKKKIEIK